MSLGRTVRSDTKVRVRQPLAGAVLHVPGDRSRLEPLLDLMAGGAERAARALRRVGRRAVRLARQAELPRARAEARARGSRRSPRPWRPTTARSPRALAAGETVTVDLAGGPVELDARRRRAVQQTQEGWGLASDGPRDRGARPRADEDLRLEGLARELVHHVQALRRSAGLDVSDRIELGIARAEPVADALAAHRDWIASEVLATSIVDGAVDGATASEDVSVEGTPARITLRVA